MLMEGPVFLYSFLIGHAHFFCDEIACLYHQRFIIGQKTFHKIVSCKPDLVLACATEFRTFQNLKSAGNLFR